MTEVHVLNSTGNQKEENVASDQLNEIVELSILYDFYGDLLKQHNKQIFEDYILNDLSLSEIADEQGISRQGVYDVVKRCSKQLKDYEARLKLIQKFNATKTKINRIKELSEKINQENDLFSDEINEVIDLSNSILIDL